MLVKRGDDTILASRAKAEPAPDVVTSDYYSQQQQIRLAADWTGRPPPAEPGLEVMLDGGDVGRLVECAIRHPSPSMRNVVLAAIWNHPETFRQLFAFGLNPPDAFVEIRKIVAEALPQRASASGPGAGGGDNALLPPMPLPAHLRDRARKQ